jgi:hypothetical protein
MKLELVKFAGKTVGYNLVPENREEKLALKSLSELHLKVEDEIENSVRYDGLETDTDEKTIVRLKFVRDKYASYDIKTLTMLGEMVVEKVEEDFSKKSHFKCTECGSKNVQMTAWVNPNNNNEFIDYTTDCTETDDCWCDDCGENVELEYVEVKPKGKKKK